jgi:hypothetical protein
MTDKYMADDCPEWLHPDDHPPPHGTKLQLFMYPHGTTIIGQWQNSGAALWSPMMGVSDKMKLRLEDEYMAKKRISLLGCKDCRNDNLSGRCKLTGHKHPWQVNAPHHCENFIRVKIKKEGT